MTFQNSYLPTPYLRTQHSQVDLTIDLMYAVQMDIKDAKKATEDGQKLAFPLPGDKTITY